MLTRTAIFSFLILFHVELNAQIQFNRALPPSPYAPYIFDIKSHNIDDSYPNTDHVFSRLSFLDFDGDGFLDAYRLGKGEIYMQKENIFSISESHKLVENEASKKIEVADFNNDGKLDIFMYGPNAWDDLESEPFFSRLKIFQETGWENTQPFPRLNSGSVRAGDYNADGLMDLVMVGRKIEGEFQENYSAIFFGTEEGGFIEEGSNIFPLKDCELWNLDFDNDGDLDVFIRNLGQTPSMFYGFYENNGNGEFSLHSSTSSFLSFESGSFRPLFGDLNDDGFQDILFHLSGFGQPQTELILMINQNGDSFEVYPEDLPFELEGWIKILDFDGDGDDDVYASDMDYPWGRHLMYLNTGEMQFDTTELKKPDFAVLSSGAYFGDINNDGKVDYITRGAVEVGGGSFDTHSEFHVSDSTGSYRRVVHGSLPGVTGAYGGIIDVNSDGFMDIVYTGNEFSSQFNRRIRYNDGLGEFAESGDLIRASTIGMMLEIDIDNDGDLDLYHVGYDYSDFDPDAVWEVFWNGEQIETPSFSPSFWFPNEGDGIAVDVDLDGDMDAVLTCATKLITGKLIQMFFVYLRTQDGFELVQANDNIPGLEFAFLASADITGDALPELFLAGEDENGNSKAYFLKNLDQGEFEIMDWIETMPMRKGDASFSDLDNDGDQDLVCTGIGPEGPKTIIYRNFYNQTMEMETDPYFPDLSHSVLRFFDLENDGDDDLLMAGKNESMRETIILYENLGDGNFQFVDDLPFVPISEGVISVGELNGLPGLDLFIAGGGTANIYFNSTPQEEGVGSTEKDEPLFQIFPNPSSSMVFVKTSENGLIEILGPDGRLMARIKSNTWIDLSHLPTGSYIFRNLTAGDSAGQALTFIKY